MNIHNACNIRGKSPESENLNSYDNNCVATGDEADRSNPESFQYANSQKIDEIKILVMLAQIKTFTHMEMIVAR